MKKPLLGEKGTDMTNAVMNRMRDDKGLSTAEYAVGTVAAAGLGGLLLKILTSDWTMELIKRVIEWAFQFLFN
jgi:hypothetical protein